MSYQEKRTITSLVSGLIFLIVYCVFMIVTVRSGTVPSDDLQYWAKIMLIFIAIGVVSQIIIQIVFHILLAISIAIKERKNEENIDNVIKSTMIEDEMDKLIELKSSKIGYIFVGVGFILALISVVMNFSFTVMINILFLSYLIGAMSEGVLSLYFYKKGV